MTEKTERLHLTVAGDTHRELGLSRGAALRPSLAGAYEKYAELFRAVGVSAEREQQGVERVLAALSAWRPAAVEELAGIAEGADVTLSQVVALNARTEIIAMGNRGASECSTLTAEIGDRRYGVQTWDWHIELDQFWHTQEVAGPGMKYVGVTEQGIVSKIGMNEAGLGLHFNILGHENDGPDGVPMHVLSGVVLSECRTVDEAIELIRSAPVASSSAFTMLDAERAVSVEMSPEGVFVIAAVNGSVQRTNHFQHEAPLAKQKTALYEPDSSERLALVRSRLAAGLPVEPAAMVEILVSGEGQPPLTCVPDMSLGYGDRWATLATVISDPTERTLTVLDGMPTEAATGPWRTLKL